MRAGDVNGSISGGRENMDVWGEGTCDIQVKLGQKWRHPMEMVFILSENGVAISDGDFQRDIT